ncbi:primase-like DNA-binding domain-containing protein, partial [Lactobacillus delbrueckii subsp. bulgaricus]
MYNIFLAWNEDSEHVSINMRPRRFKNELKQSVEKLGWKFMAKNIPSDMLPAVKMNPTDFDSFTP